MQSILRVGDELDDGNLNEFHLVLAHLEEIAQVCIEDGVEGPNWTQVSISLRSAMKALKEDL